MHKWFLKRIELINQKAMRAKYEYRRARHDYKKSFKEVDGKR